MRLAAVFVASLVIALPSPLRADPPTVLTIAVGQDIDTLDPRSQTLSSAASIAGHMFDSLLRPNDERTPAPSAGPIYTQLAPHLATTWRVTPDGLTYTFTLRQGVQFQDGAPFDAAAVKLNVERWLDPAVPNPNRHYFAEIDPDRIETPDRHTLVLHLRGPSSVFLQQLASGAAEIVSPRALKTLGDEGLGRAPVDAGTGPYRFREWVPGDHITVVRNPRYWGRKPFFDVLVFRIVPEADTRETLLRAGSVQMAVGLPGTDLAALRRDAALRVLEEPSDEVIFVSLNTQWGPLRDVRVRRALNYAVDKDTVVRTLLPGLADVLDSPLPRSLPGYAPVQPGGWPYDPLKARRLLAEAGYPKGFGIILGTPLGWYTEDYQVAIAVAKQLENIGVTTPTPGISASDVFVGSGATYVRWLSTPPNWTPPQLILGGWASPYLDPDGALVPQFTRSQWPPGGRAASYYDNPRVDALLRAARRTLGPTARDELYRQTQALIWQDAPWIFLWAQHSYVATSRRLHDVTLAPNARWAAIYAEWR